jgi:hypothetical protein
VLLLAGAIAALSGCDRRSGSTAAPVANEPVTQIETLPSDESDATPSDELANGDDEADANSTTSANTDTLQD